MLLPFLHDHKFPSLCFPDVFFLEILLYFLALELFELPVPRAELLHRGLWVQMGHWWAVPLQSPTLPRRLTRREQPEALGPVSQLKVREGVAWTPLQGGGAQGPPAHPRPCGHTLGSGWSFLAISALSSVSACTLLRRPQTPGRVWTPSTPWTRGPSRKVKQVETALGVHGRVCWDMIGGEAVSCAHGSLAGAVRPAETWPVLPQVGPTLCPPAWKRPQDRSARGRVPPSCRTSTSGT